MSNREEELLKYIDKIVTYLIEDTYHYNWEFAIKLISIHYNSILDDFIKENDPYDVAIEIGYCCG